MTDPTVEPVAFIYADKADKFVTFRRSSEHAGMVEAPLYTSDAIQAAVAAERAEIVAASEPLVKEIERLWRDYGSDRPDHQLQTVMLSARDLKRFATAIEGIIYKGEVG